MGLLDRLRRLFSGNDPHVRLGSERGRRQGTPIARERRAEARPPRPLAPGLPAIPDPGALADHLELSERELRWLADPCRLAARKCPHYRLHLHPKKSGGIRVVLAPLPRLRAVQTRILRTILDPLEPPPHAHGFVRGRSIRTNAAAHVGKDILVQFDLADFFHQLTLRRVRGLFRRLGYSDDVARQLSFLTTAPIKQMMPVLASEPFEPRSRLWEATAQKPYWSHHACLPQGAPSSPAIANHLAARLDARLAGLARNFDAGYTRYADDLAVSGGAELRKGMRRFIPLARRVVREEGFQLAPKKLRVTRKGTRQVVTGIVVNRRLSVPREEQRALRAIVHNCLRRGPSSENRDGHPDFRAHLRGRIAHVASIDPARGRELGAAFERIAW